MASFPFVVRVYGIYVHPEKGVLVSDEFVFGRYITKFPGGGLEFGEGTVECLQREMMEETGLAFTVQDHFYTTDFFVPSAFDPTIQVVSIYYKMVPAEDALLKVSAAPFDFESSSPSKQSFRFIPLKELTADHLTLVIDQRVAELLCAIRR